MAYIQLVGKLLKLVDKKYPGQGPAVGGKLQCSEPVDKTGQAGKQMLTDGKELVYAQEQQVGKWEPIAGQELVDKQRVCEQKLIAGQELVDMQVGEQLAMEQVFEQELMDRNEQLVVEAVNRRWMVGLELMKELGQD